MDGPPINGRNIEGGQGGGLRSGASAGAFHACHSLLHVDFGHEDDLLVDLEPL